jgi:hypothetical protein
MSETKLTTKRFTTYLKPSIIDALKDVAYEDRLTVNFIVSEAVEAHLTKIIQKRGSAYPKRKGELPRGRLA